MQRTVFYRPKTRGRNGKYYPSPNPWKAEFRFEGRRVYVGVFPTEGEALERVRQKIQRLSEQSARKG
jgi:hypothetical protein